MIDLLLELLVEILWQFLGELLFEIIRLIVRTAADSLFEGNGRVLASDLVRKVGWHLFGGIAVGALSIGIHPGPLAMRSSSRVVALVLMPLASGLALAAWDTRGGRGGQGRGRAGFWAGTSFGCGYVLVRLVLAWLRLHA